MPTNLCFLRSGNPLGSRCITTILKKNQHFSTSGQGRDRLLLRCKKYKEKASQGIPVLPSKLHLAGAGRRDTCPFTAGTLTLVYTS